MSVDDIIHRAERARELRRVLGASTLRHPELVPNVDCMLTDDVPEIPRWPSGLYSSFDAIFGGFPGLTVYAGPSGTGKSILGLGCALENAMTPGTCVVYLDCENAQGNQARRALRWFGSEPGFAHGMQSIALHFHWTPVLPGMTWEQLMLYASGKLLQEHERILLVLDSVSSMSRLLPGKQLDTLSRIYVALAAIVRASGGRVQVLGLSELNGKGDVKGLEGVYAADLAIKLVREPDEGDNIVRLNMVKHRSGRFQFDLGLYEVLDSSCRMRKMDYAAPAFQAAHG